MSLRLVLRGMGAAPCSAGMLRRQWQLLRRRIAVARLRDAAHARFRYGQHPGGPRQKSQQGGVQEDSSSELSVESSASSTSSSLPLPTVVVECNGPRILP